ncbi:hypothetical protein [Agromyces sp. SYSU T00194]|uniref:hypothetical protein n=1 Tax=Agromyces chitinivorans TaxID=3158560 RepID=UPI00339252CC
MSMRTDALERRISTLHAQSRAISDLAGWVATAPSMLPGAGGTCWASASRNRYDARLRDVLQRLHAVRALLEDGADAAGRLAARLELELDRAAADDAAADVLAALGVGTGR